MLLVSTLLLACSSPTLPARAQTPPAPPAPTSVGAAPAAPVRGANRIGSLKVGDVAPDAQLVRVDGTSINLMSAKKPGRPLVLIFGSFT
jgi:hypothetical protein